MTRPLPTISSALFASLLIGTVSAQISVTTDLDATQLAVEVFQGSGVTISNETLIGNTQGTMASVGSYAATNITLLPDNGVVLSTGFLNGLDGPATNFNSDQTGGSATDPDLMQLTGVGVYDLVALEFDFVPDENLLTFDFVFASEEYPEYVCELFNDGFGFFLSGPGISGPYSNNAANIALLPGSATPITINNVNNGSIIVGNCPPSNEQYYVDNTAGATIVFDGLSTILPISAAVVPGQTYHIKLVIGDAGDSVFNSCLFLKAGSFRSVSSISTGVAAHEYSDLKAWFDTNGALRISDIDPIGRMELFDGQGRSIHQAVYNSNLISIPTEDLEQGPYVLRTATGTVRLMNVR